LQTFVLGASAIDELHNDYRQPVTYRRKDRDYARHQHHWHEHHDQAEREQADGETIWPEKVIFHSEKLSR
jgi:hypothetical protein